MTSFRTYGLSKTTYVTRGRGHLASYQWILKIMVSYFRLWRGGSRQKYEKNMFLVILIVWRHKWPNYWPFCDLFRCISVSFWATTIKMVSNERSTCCTYGHIFWIIFTCYLKQIWLSPVVHTRCCADCLRPWPFRDAKWSKKSIICTIDFVRKNKFIELFIQLNIAIFIVFFSCLWRHNSGSRNRGPIS